MEDKRARDRQRKILDEIGYNRLGQGLFEEGLYQGTNGAVSLVLDRSEIDPAIRDKENRSPTKLIEWKNSLGELWIEAETERRNWVPGYYDQYDPHGDINPWEYEVHKIAQQGKFVASLIEEQLEANEEMLLDLDEELYQQAKIAEENFEDTKEFFPSHWLYAKEYWDRILDMVLAPNSRITKKGYQRIAAKIQTAKARKEISTYMYAMIRLSVAYRRGERDIINKVLEDLVKIKLRYEKAGWPWAPKVKDESWAQVDTEEKFSATIYPWDKLEEHFDRHMGWAE